MNIKDKKVLSQLIYTNQRLNESQELSRIGSWDWDVNTNIVVWSDMMFKLLGLSPLEVEPSYDLALHHVHKKDKERYELVLAKALETKTEYYLENLITCKDNSTISVISRGKCILDSFGNLTRMMGTVQDVTLEQHLKEKAQEGERLRSAFLENISHEIRTPLNAILGFSELVVNKNIADKNRAKYIEQINKSGKRLLNFLTDIINISKIETRSSKLFVENCNLNTIVNQLLLEFQKANQNNKIKLKSHTELADDESFIKTDVIKLKIILSKLIDNAVKYTHIGIIDFGYVLEAGFIKFNVKDTGIGISEKMQQQLFDLFKQIENNKTKLASLGIPLAKGMVDLFGGKIWFETKKEQGTNFFFTIPYVKCNKTQNRLSNNLNKSGKKTILIAEDDPANYLLFTINMKNHFNILHAKNGKEAVEIFTKHLNSIDLILMDIKMPEMNGFDASIAIRKFDNTIPIITHTAFIMEDQLKQMEEIGINDILNKPADLNDINKVIEKYT